MQMLSCCRPGTRSRARTPTIKPNTRNPVISNLITAADVVLPIRLELRSFPLRSKTATHAAYEGRHSLATRRGDHGQLSGTHEHRQSSRRPPGTRWINRRSRRARPRGCRRILKRSRGPRREAPRWGAARSIGWCRRRGVRRRRAGQGAVVASHQVSSSSAKVMVVAARRSPGDGVVASARRASSAAAVRRSPCTVMLRCRRRPVAGSGGSATRSSHTPR